MWWWWLSFNFRGARTHTYGVHNDALLALHTNWQTVFVSGTEAPHQQNKNYIYFFLSSKRNEMNGYTFLHSLTSSPPPVLSLSLYFLSFCLGIWWSIGPPVTLRSWAHKSQYLIHIDTFYYDKRDVMFWLI